MSKGYTGHHTDDSYKSGDTAVFKIQSLPKVLGTLIQ